MDHWNGVVYAIHLNQGSQTSRGRATFDLSTALRSPKWIKNGLIFWWEGTEEWPGSELSGCLWGCTVGAPSSPSHKIPNNKRRSTQTSHLASIYLKRLHLMCSLYNWLKSSYHKVSKIVPWKITNSTEQTIPCHPSTQLFFSPLTCCTSLLSSPLFYPLPATPNKGLWNLDSDFLTFLMSKVSLFQITSLYQLIL